MISGAGIHDNDESSGTLREGTWKGGFDWALGAQMQKDPSQPYIDGLKTYLPTCKVNLSLQ